MTFFDVFGGSDFRFLVVLGFPNPCWGNLGCYFGVSLCFSLCYPKLGIPLTGRPCVFGGVLMFIFCVVLMLVLFLSVLWFSVGPILLFCLILGHLPPSLDPRPRLGRPRPRRLSVLFVVFAFLVATTFNTILSFWLGSASPSPWWYSLRVYAELFLPLSITTAFRVPIFVTLHNRHGSDLVRHGLFRALFNTFQHHFEYLPWLSITSELSWRFLLRNLSFSDGSQLKAISNF